MPAIIVIIAIVYGYDYRWLNMEVRKSEQSQRTTVFWLGDPLFTEMAG